MRNFFGSGGPSAISELIVSVQAMAGLLTIVDIPHEPAIKFNQ